MRAIAAAPNDDGSPYVLDDAGLVHTGLWCAITDDAIRVDAGVQNAGTNLFHGAAQVFLSKRLLRPHVVVSRLTSQA